MIERSKALRQRALIARIRVMVLIEKMEMLLSSDKQQFPDGEGVKS